MTLYENLGKSFQGSIVLGMGFTFEDHKKSTAYDHNDLSAIGTPTSIKDLEILIERDPKNKERIFPYIGGKELNSHPSHIPHRFVIHFENISEEEAWQWPDLMGIIKRKVKPQRDLLAHNSVGRKRKREWWLYGSPSTHLYQSIKGLTRVLATCSQAMSHFVFSFLPKGYIYSSTLAIIALDSYASFAVLQSQIHETWSCYFMSTLKNDLAYTVSTCFQNFPFPPHWQSNLRLEQTGLDYYTFRAKLMADESTRDLLMNGLPCEGMTKTYNHFHDLECKYEGINTLRSLKRAMNEAVKEAYGWTDMTLKYDWIDHYSGFLLKERLEELMKYQEMSLEKAKKEVKPRYTFTPETKDRIMEYLLALNIQRAAINPKK